MNRIKLLHAVAKSQTIEKLNIGYNAGTESCVGAIKHVLMDPTKNEDDDDADDQDDIIPSAPSLTELNLEGNQLSPEAGTIILHALTHPTKKNTHILHINLDANFLTKHDVILIESKLQINRQGAAFKFRYEPTLLQQKWNWNASLYSKRSIRDKKVLKKRTDEDNKLKIAKEKKKMKRDRKKNGKEGPPGCLIL